MNKTFYDELPVIFFRSLAREIGLIPAIIWQEIFDAVTDLDLQENGISEITTKSLFVKVNFLTEKEVLDGLKVVLNASKNKNPHLNVGMVGDTIIIKKGN